MQWLIDIITEAVIAAIGIPPCYIDRGTYVGTDFDLGDLTADNNWHELDLSAIVPAGASAVHIRIKGKSTAIPRFIRMRKHGSTTNTFSCIFRTVVANIDNNSNPTVGVSTDRKIDYLMSAPDWATVDFVIRGWWL